MRFFIPMCLIALLASMPVLAATPSTKLDDSQNRIGFAFDNEFSIRFAPMVSHAPTNANCGASEEGIIRFNKHPSVNSIEFCNGTDWVYMGKKGPKDIYIDYKTCTGPSYSGNNGLAKFGTPTPKNMDASCNRRDHVMVATDSAGPGNSHDYFYCCQMKFVY